MDTSISKSDSLIVKIDDVVAYILGDEKIVIPLDKLTTAQSVRLLCRYATRVKAYLRRAGKSFEDVCNSLEFKSGDFAMLLPDKVSTKTRLVQLSVAFLGGLPNQPSPTAEESSWLTHTLFVSENGEFFLASLASGRGRSTQFKFERFDAEVLAAQFFSYHKTACKECLEFLGRMWEQSIARQEERLEKIKERLGVHKSVVERLA